MTEHDPGMPGKQNPQVEQTSVSSLLPPQQALPILSPPQTHGLAAVPWSLVAVKEDERHAIVVVAADLETIQGVEVEESPNQVTVTVYRTLPPTGPSFAISVHTTALVELPSRLGARRLAGMTRPGS